MLTKKPNIKRYVWENIYITQIIHTFCINVQYFIIIYFLHNFIISAWDRIFYECYKNNNKIFIVCILFMLDMNLLFSYCYITYGLWVKC